ncbi:MULTISPECIES: beta strand repeat-containing protein, partial [unclassified Mesorhizobium]|uniref:beta strand repeat-containing protein n=1 Tax=unclassified Mesorhizobium TaxID=325217 RepID=UPI001CC9DBC9
AIKVTDSDNDTANASLTVKVNDDGPHANNDSATQTTENAPFTIDALANDVFGADGVAVGDTSKVTFTQATQGVVSYDATTHLFTYTPNAGAGSSSTADSFTYTIIDGDGDKSTATVSLTLKADSIPTITVTPEGGSPSVNATAVVDEKGLPAGTGELADPALNSDHSETTAGTFNITTGGDTLQKLEVMDKNSALVDVTAGGTVQGVNGVLTVSVSGGVYSYSYTLSNNVTNANPNQIGAADQATGENFAIKVTDSDNDTANASLTVKVNDDGPVFTLVNDGNGDGIVSLSALNPATATTYNGQFAEWQYGADGFGGVSATGQNVQIASSSASQIVLNLMEGSDVVAKLTLNANGTDSLEVLHRTGDIVFNPIAATSATAGGPTGSLLVDLGAATNFNIVVTGDDGNGTPGQSSDEVNTSSQGWAVKGGAGQSNDPGESIKFAFVDDGNNTTGHGVDDFKFTTQGYTGGMGTAKITVLVYLNASMTIYDQVTLSATSGNVIQISNLDWSAAAGTGNYIAGDAIYGVKVISDSTNTGGFRLNGVEVGAASQNPPADLDFNGIKVTVTDHDGDTASQTFNVHIDGTTGNQLTVEAIAGTSGNDSLTGTATGDTLIGGAGNDTICGGGGNDILIGGTGADQFRLATNTGTDTVKDFLAGTDKIGLLDTGSTGSGSVNFANTTGTSAGNALNASDFALRGSVSALTVGDSAHIVQISAAQTSAQIAAATAAVAVNAYVLVFNSTTGHGELWFDTNWSDATGRTQVATFDNITTLGQLTTLTSTDFVVYNSATDPIILDLNHDGFTFSDLSHGVQFDINGDGTKDHLAWNTSNDGMLAVDLNHDGKIDDGTELFTPNFNGGHFASGAAALASLDSNHDGVIDHNDAAFSSLLIWKDANANGASDAGELSKLADNGIVSISTAANQAVGEIDGQTVTGNGTFHMADGTTGNYVEVELDTSLVAPAPASVASDGTKTFAIGSLEVTDLIADFHDGDKIDLSALLKGLAGVTDLESTGYVQLAQSSANPANTDVMVDTNGGGDNFHTVAVLENYVFNSAAEAVKILYDDSHGTKTDVA